MPTALIAILPASFQALNLRLRGNSKNSPEIGIDGTGCAARSALPCLAVPADRHVGRLLRLHAVDGIEHNHPLGFVGLIVLEGAASTGLGAPDSESRLRH
jgi:hypothetical protein